MIPRAGPEGRAYTLGFAALYAVCAIAVLMLVAGWHRDAMPDIAPSIGDAFMALLVLGGAIQAPNVAERIGTRNQAHKPPASTDPTDYGAKTPTDL